MTGLIIPPGEIKKLLEKTAQHVALNGSEFEKILIEREQHKPQFAFLKPDSPYRAYYDHRVAEISKKMIQGLANEQPKEEEKVEALPAVKQEEQQGQQGSFLEKIFEQLREPDPEIYVAEIPQKLGEGEQAIIQHTAQYAARNGRNFLLALSEREKNNPQFEFLRPSSKSHLYFTRLMQAYSAILEIQVSDVDRLQKCLTDREAIFSACRLVYDYHMAKQQQARGKKEQAAKQVKQSNIDWNDFELVDTITFETEANNIAGGELMARIQQHQQNLKPSQDEKIIGQVKKRDIVQHCHACRQVILASEMNKHLKTCLSQKRKTTQGSSAQVGQEVDIRANLESLSIRRPDIFGTVQNKITRQQQAGGEEQRIIFDGQAPNLTRTTGSIAMLHFQQKRLKEQQERNNK